MGLIRQYWSMTFSVFYHLPRLDSTVLKRRVSGDGEPNLESNNSTERLVFKFTPAWVSEKINHQTKKVQTKVKKGEKRKQPEVVDQ